MTPNAIKRKLEEAGITQADAASMMPDSVGKVGMSFIVTGKVLPTKVGMQTLCSMLSCAPSDLYTPDDLNLLEVTEDPDAENVNIISAPSRSGRQHDGMCELRAWLRPYEKEALTVAVHDLGYRSVAEWLREMIRNTVARNKRLQIPAPTKTA